MKITQSRLRADRRTGRSGGRLALGGDASAAAQTDPVRLRFNGGIGVIPVSSGVLDNGAATTALVAPSVTRNIVRGVQTCRPDLGDRRARCQGEGERAHQVDGKGLILAAGTMRERAAGQSVFATLICEPTPPFTERVTPLAGVLLSPTGDFKIDAALAPLPPDICASPMPGSVNAAGGACSRSEFFRPDNN